MIKNNKIEINLSNIEIINLKRFLGSNGIIDKDVSIGLSKYIKKYMQEEKKEVKKETNIIELENWEGDCKTYKLNKEKIFLMGIFQNDSPDTVDLDIVYLDDNNIVQQKFFSAGWKTERSQDRCEQLVEGMKSVDTIKISLWKSKISYESEEIFIVKKYIKSVSIDKKEKVIHIYGPNGYLYSTSAFFNTPNQNKLFKEATKKLKEYIKE